MGKKNPVVQDVGDIRLGGEPTEGGGIVFGGKRLSSDDAKALVAPDEAGPGRDDMSFRIDRDVAIAINDQIMVCNDAIGVNLACGRGIGLPGSLCVRESTQGQNEQK
jgi:hypothetical protein